MVFPPQTFTRAAISAALLISLAACGGGGGGGGGFPLVLPPTTDGGTPAPAPAPAPDTGGGTETPAPAPEPAPAPAPAPDTGGGTVEPPAPPAPVPGEDSGVAASCSALTSGTYRYLTSLDEDDPTGLLRIKAGVLEADGTTRTTQVTNAAEETSTLMPVADKPCEFTLNTNTHVAFGPSGVALAATPLGSTYAVTLLIPEQTGDSAVTLADLNGTYNRLSWERPDDDSSFAMSYGAMFFSSGTLTDGVNCPVTVSIAGGCTEQWTAAANSGFIANSTLGGFSGTGDLAGYHGYAFKINGVVTLLAFQPENGSVVFMSNQRSMDLPPATGIGVAAHSWGYNARPNGYANEGLTSATNTITAVDANTNTVTRTTEGNPTAQTLRYNAPLPGLRKRDGADGTPDVPNSGISPAIQFPLGGGLAVGSRLGATTTNAFLSLSLSKPIN